MRLFVALGLPAEVKDELARVAAALAPSNPGARWVPRDNFHVTLSFLGSVADERLEEIVGALGSAAGRASRGASRLEQLGAFPSARRARVVWAGLADEDGSVRAVAAAAIDAMAGVGFPPEARPFRPHVTLARLRDPGPVTLAGVEPRSLLVPVERVTLFRSHLGGPAARYEVVAEIPVGAP